MKPFVGLVLLSLIAAGGAQAQLAIEITKRAGDALPIAVVPFGAAGPLPEDVAAIVAADLQRSGRFEPLQSGAYLERPTALGEINFATWRALLVDHVVVGQVRPNAAGGYTVRFDLAEVFQGSPLLSLSFDAGANELRRVAHRISDLVYEKITGERGAFSTRIAYVSVSRGQTGDSFSLVVADADGYDPHVVLRSSEPLMSPTWSPDGSRLAYVSFEGRKSQVVVQDVYTGSRQTISDHPGVNGAPAWSPDGRYLALTLSKDGDPDLYLYNLASRNLARLTSTQAIDTEAAFSPDGTFLVFTSDRGGSPQLYRLNLGDDRPVRLTFDGDYNAGAAVSPDGRSLALVHRRAGVFHIALMDLQTRQLTLLTDGGLDESPSFAPNGRMVIYATTQGGRGVLAAASVDGRVRQSLVAREGDVREPAWSPYVR